MSKRADGVCSWRKPDSGRRALHDRPERAVHKAVFEWARLWVHIPAPVVFLAEAENVADRAVGKEASSSPRFRVSGRPGKKRSASSAEGMSTELVSFSALEP